MRVYRPGLPDPEITQLDRSPTLEELRAGVEGHIEHVPGFDLLERPGGHERCVVFCNEEGKLDGLEINRIATILWMRSRQPTRPLDDYLVGPVVVLTGDDEFLESL